MSNSDPSRLAPRVTMSDMLSTVSATHSTCQNMMLAKSFKIGKNFCELLLSHFNSRNSLSWDSNKPFTVFEILSFLKL